MALTIVRNDITQMHVDAIVNTTNVRLEVGGLGVDAGIHYAAGPELKEALAEIGTCPVGSAVITESFDIPFCRYIIHTVGPIYIDGHHGEREDLESCYRSILALAKEKGCRSLAIPSISTGAYGYPKAEAYSIATSCIRDFLLSLPDGEDMMIYIVLYDRESVAVSAKIDSGVQHFISEAYRKNRKRSCIPSMKETVPAPVPARCVHPSVLPYGKGSHMPKTRHSRKIWLHRCSPLLKRNARRCRRLLPGSSPAMAMRRKIVPLPTCVNGGAGKKGSPKRSFTSVRISTNPCSGG